MSTIRSSQLTARSRSRSMSQPTFSSAKTSKSLDLPSSLGSDVFRILRHIVLVFCRRFIFAPPTSKIFLYFFLIILGPFFKDIKLIPNTSLSSKANILNIYIAKISWLWSIFLLAPFIYLTSLIYTRGHYGLIIRHLFRLLISTIILYIITYLLIRLEALTGMCKPIDISGIIRRVCRSGARYQWQEGHTFFLLYALLVINEEVKLYDESWKKVEAASKINTGNTNTSFIINQNRIKMFSIPIGILYIALAILTILWEFMLLSTALYFYNILHKLIATCAAVFFWFITYRVWYRGNSSSNIAPCSPGDGFIAF